MFLLDRDSCVWGGDYTAGVTTFCDSTVETVDLAGEKAGGRESFSDACFLHLEDNHGSILQNPAWGSVAKLQIPVPSFNHW
ncbi:MAG: hypothetical protein M3Y56_16590, partial [Armatimonadota bacterium]|nr:hypothetical protein [Armatimonadota bacterium]